MCLKENIRKPHRKIKTLEKLTGREQQRNPEDDLPQKNTTSHEDRNEGNHNMIIGTDILTVKTNPFETIC